MVLNVRDFKKIFPDDYKEFLLQRFVSLFEEDIDDTPTNFYIMALIIFDWLSESIKRNDLKMFKLLIQIFPDDAFMLAPNVCHHKRLAFLKILPKRQTDDFILGYYQGLVKCDLRTHIGKEMAKCLIISQKLLFRNDAKQSIKVLWKKVAKEHRNNNKNMILLKYINPEIPLEIIDIIGEYLKY